MTNTQAGFITTLKITWQDRNTEWSPHRVPSTLQPANNTEADYQRYYEENNWVPFQITWTAQKYKRDEKHPFINTNAVLDPHYSVFTLTTPFYAKDSLWYIPNEGKLSDIRRAPFVMYKHPKHADDHKRTKNIYYFPKLATIAIIRDNEIIYFPHNQFVYPNEIPPDAKLYIIPQRKSVEQAELALKQNGENGWFYWNPTSVLGFFISKNTLKREGLASTLDDIYHY